MGHKIIIFVIVAICFFFIWGYIVFHLDDIYLFIGGLKDVRERWVILFRFYPFYPINNIIDEMS